MYYAIWVVAFGFAVMGIAALVRPAIIGNLVELRFDSVTARNEARAVYGGFGLTMAAALVLATQVPEWKAGILIAVGLALAGMSLGRVFSALIERPGLAPWLYCLLEAVAASVLFLAVKA